jgi:hypothetical protein
MLVFHTLLAGNIGQFAAPGTVVAGDFAGAGAFVAVAVGAGVAVGADAGVAAGFSVLGPAVSVIPNELVAVTPVRLPAFAASFAPTLAGLAGLAGLAAQPAAQVTAATATAVRNVNFLDAKCPVRMLTVESWHGRYPAYPATAKFVTLRADTRRAAVAVLYSATHGGTPFA